MVDLSRSERRADRHRHRDQVPDLLRAPPEQGHLALSPVPRDLRSLRHAVQRVRTRGARRPPARHADGAGHAKCSPNRRGCSPTRGTPRRGWRGTTASRRSRCTIRRRSPAAQIRPARRLRPVGRPARNQQARRSGHRAPWRTSLAAVRLIVAGDGPLRAQLEDTAATSGVADRVTFAGGVDEERAGRRCTRARSPSSSPRSTRTTAT